MSIVLAWSQNGTQDGPDGDTPEEAAEIAAAARERDSAATHARELDMGHTALPAGAVFYGAQPENKGKSKGPLKPGH